jgi:hypothetical protein
MKKARLFTAITMAAAMQALPKPSFAMPFTEIRVEEMLRGEGELKKSLHLNSNQQLLWDQTQVKTRALLRTRQARREQLQATLKLALINNSADLRELAAKIDADAELNQREERQLRELWLTVNDALDDTQRQTALQFLADQLERMPGPDREMTGNKPSGEMHGGRRGGMHGGMGGGMGGGMDRP